MADEMAGSLGDAAQVRMIVEQVLDAERAINGDGFEKIERHINRTIESSIVALEAKMNRRLLGAIFANAIPMIIAAFFMGGLWVKFQDVPGILEGRGTWMRHTEDRIMALERHADRQDSTYVKPETVILPD